MFVEMYQLTVKNQKFGVESFLEEESSSSHQTIQLSDSDRLELWIMRNR